MSDRRPEQTPGWLEEKRRAPRLGVDYDLQVTVSNENSFYTGLARNISSGGIFIATDAIHQVGDIVRIRFSFPGLEKPTEVDGVVQWYRDPFSGRAGPTGIGVRFRNLPAHIAEKIDSYLAGGEVLLFEEGY